VSTYFVPAFQIEVNGSHLQADVSRNIQHLEVVSMPNTLDTFTFTLANALPTMRWTHTDDAQLFVPGHSVRIAMGYVDDIYEMMEGEITQVSPTFPDSGVPTVTIVGHSRMHRLCGEPKTRTFQKTTPKEIVEKIGKEALLDVEAEDVNLQLDYMMQGNKTDIEFLRELAQSMHCEVLVQASTLIFRKAREAYPKSFTLVWFGPQESFAPAPDTMPLKSFTPTMNTLEPPTNVQYRAYDMKQKRAFVSNANQSKLMGGNQTAAQAVQNYFDLTRTVVHVTTPFLSQDEGDRYSKSAFNAKAMGFISGQATTIGIPELWSGKVVELVGLGPLFNGCYYIQQATHTIDESGYNTSFTVQRNSN
jgi:uncharacterized protein